jgi:hypothetical protein
VLGSSRPWTGSGAGSGTTARARRRVRQAAWKTRELGAALKKRARDRPVVRFEITPRSLIPATIAGVWLVYERWIVPLILAMALILTGTFNPLIEWMEEGYP